MSDFDTIKSQDLSQRDRFKRISQRDVLPLSTKLRLTEFFDAKNDLLLFKDYLGNEVLKVELTNGTVTFGTNVKFSGAITKGVSPASFVKKMHTPLVGGGASSGGGANSFYTDASTYQKIHQSRITLDPDDYPGASFYLQAVYRAGAFGDSLRAFLMNLHDINAGADVTDSEITDDETSSVGNVLPILTGSTDFRGNMTSGDRDYVVQIRSDTSGSFVDLYEARLVIEY